MAAAGHGASTSQGDPAAQVLGGGGVSGATLEPGRPLLASQHAFRIAAGLLERLLDIAVNRVSDGTGPPGAIVRSLAHQLSRLLPIAQPVRARAIAVALRI